MKRIFSTLLSVFVVVFFVFSQEEIRPTKNLIVMIPDGTSLGVLSASRWMKVYRGEGDRLHLDPYLSGTVTTFSSNAPVGDSAPTTSTYMTGVPMQRGNVAIYPEVDPKNDLIPLDPAFTNQPQMTILEAMRIEQKKAVGLVVTVEFPHATPADCSAHHYNRNRYDEIAPQMAYNNLSVMFGGGHRNITPDMQAYFKTTNTAYIQEDKEAAMNFEGDKLWALFASGRLQFDIDRNPKKEPSLAEMTKKAIEILNKNENGFFMMVEGSLIDYAAHANDPAGIIGDFLAFDEAFGVALDFAKKDGNTTIVVLPDHGNAGFTIGSAKAPKGISQMTLSELFSKVSKIKRTAAGMEDILKNTPSDDFKSVFKSYTDIDLTDDDVKTLLSSKNYKLEDYTAAKGAKNMSNYIVDIYNRDMAFGYTSGSHTGEEVFLAVYHPQGDILKGNVRNVELHDYLYKVSGLQTPMKEHTDKAFAKHTDVFEGMKYEVVAKKGELAKLIVKQKKNTLEVNASSSVVLYNGNAVQLESVVVYVDKNNTFYLPHNLKELFNKK